MEQIIVEVCNTDIQWHLLHIVSQTILEILLLGIFISLVLAQKIISYFLMFLRDFKGKECMTIGP